MAQVKKEEVRASILRAARALFEKKGYSETTLRAIAHKADLSLANIYVYFDSKLDIVFALFEPWFRTEIERLESDAKAEQDSGKRLELIFRRLWQDIAADKAGLTVTLMQALSTSPDGYSPDLIEWARDRVAALITSCLEAPDKRAAAAAKDIAYILFMAFDGFAINSRLNKAARCSDGMVLAMTTALGALGPTARRAAPTRRAA